MNKKKEVAKFLCGMTAFDAINHAALHLSGNVPIKFFGITLTPELNTAGIIAFAILSILLGYYAWARR